MGIIKQGILGGFSGKVGSVVGTSWKGRAVMKAMPLSVANPRTSGQVNQRTKFTQCVALAKSLLGGSIALLDNPFAGSISGYNRFVKRNIVAFVNDGTLIPSQLTISQGALGGILPSADGVLNIERRAVSFAFDSIDSPFNLDRDEVIAVAISVDNGDVLQVGTLDAERNQGFVNVVLNRVLQPNETIAFYFGCVRDDKKYASNSTYYEQTFA